MRQLLFCALLLLLTWGVEAQPRQLRQQQERKTDIKSFQTAQIEQMLKLDGKRLEEFRTLYNAYFEASKTAKPDREFQRDIERSDKEIEENIKESFAQARERIDIQEKYYEEFREILSPREISAMYEVERRIRERSIYELRARESESKQQRN